MPRARCSRPPAVPPRGRRQPQRQPTTACLLCHRRRSKKTMLQRGMTHESSVSRLSDDQLAAQVVAAARDERHATARLVAALAEFDARRLYLGQGCASLFAYCTDVLHLSEAATCNRTEGARAAARFPMLLARLEDGALTLTAVRVLAPVLTQENCETLLAAAVHQSKREIEKIVAKVRPSPDVPTVIRKLPARRPAAPPSLSTAVGAHLQTHSPRDGFAELSQRTEGSATRLPSPPSAPTHAMIAPLSAERYKIQFTASRELHDKLRRAQDLLRHCVAHGDTAAIFERGLDLLLAQIEKRRLGAVERPRGARTSSAHSRHIPAVVRREVSRRDQQRCAFVGAAGCCQERAFLEFHHVRPYADGGPATVDNIQLRCRAHNQYEAALVFPVAPPDEGHPELFELEGSV